MSKVVRLSADTLQELEHYRKILLGRYKQASLKEGVNSLNEDRLLYCALIDANQKLSWDSE